jgi:hypothetical protein
VSALFLLENSASCLYAKMGVDKVFTYRNDLFKSNFAHIKPVKFDHLVSDEEDTDEIQLAFDRAKKTPNNPRVFNCRTLKRNGVHQWIVWEVCYIMGEYHLLGVMLYDVVSSTSHQYEKLKKQLEDVKSIIAHDLRQPLRSIVGLNSLLQQVDKKTDPWEYANLLRMLNESTQQLDDVFKRAIERGEIGFNTH